MPHPVVVKQQTIPSPSKRVPCVGRAELRAEEEAEEGWTALQAAKQRAAVT